MLIERSRFATLARAYREHLFGNIMPFWGRNSPDRANGGYFHMLDREGNVTGTDKNLWCQGRMTYMYSALYHQMGRDPKMA